MKDVAALLEKLKAALPPDPELREGAVLLIDESRGILTVGFQWFDRARGSLIATHSVVLKALEDQEVDGYVLLEKHLTHQLTSFYGKAPGPIITVHPGRPVLRRPH